MKKDRNCGGNMPYPVYPTYQTGMMPMPGMPGMPGMSISPFMSGAVWFFSYVAHIVLSNSFAITILKPSRSKPKSRPPAPENKLIIFI